MNKPAAPHGALHHDDPEDDRAFQESLRLALAMSAAEAAGAPPPPPPPPPPPARRSPPAPKSGRASSPTKAPAAARARRPARRSAARRAAPPPSPARSRRTRTSSSSRRRTPKVERRRRPASSARRSRPGGGGKGQVLGWYATSPLEAAASHDEARAAQGRRTNGRAAPTADGSSAGRPSRSGRRARRGTSGSRPRVASSPRRPPEVLPRHRSSADQASFPRAAGGDGGAACRGFSLAGARRAGGDADGWRSAAPGRPNY